MNLKKNKKKKMKKYNSIYIGMSLIFIFFIFWLFCFKMISPGYVGVVVDMLGDNKGVESKELHVGMH